MIYNGAPTVILKTTDLSTLRTLTPPAGYQLANYDPATKNMLYQMPSGTKVYLINIDTLKVTEISAWSTGWTFINGWLIHNSGYCKKIM
jgi:hypothetical protein